MADPGSENVILRDSLEKRGKTVASWSKRTVTLLPHALVYTARILWNLTTINLTDVLEVAER